MTNNYEQVLRIEKLDLWQDGSMLAESIDLQLSAGEIVCVIGASGIGKSTLLKAIAGLHQEYKAKLLQISEGLEKKFLKLSYLEQNTKLLPWLNLRDNIVLPSRLMGQPVDYKSKSLEQLLEMGELTNLANKFPSAISGGEKQRVALLRALWPNPRLLLLDEPFSQLDPRLRQRLSLRLREHILLNKQSALVVTHHLDEAELLADRIYCLAGYPAKLLKNEDTFLARKSA